MIIARFAHQRDDDGEGADKFPHLPSPNTTAVRRRRFSFGELVNVVSTRPPPSAVVVEIAANHSGVNTTTPHIQTHRSLFLSAIPPPPPSALTFNLISWRRQR